MDFLLYSLHEPDTGEVRYVGKTARGRVRLDEHLRPPKRSDRSHRAKWLRSLRREGLRPVCSVIERYATEQELNAAEVEWIFSARAAGARLTNHRDGGDGGSFDDEVREKISAANRGKVAWNKGKQGPSGSEHHFFGKRHTLETRAKIGASRRSKTHCARGGHPLSGDNLYMTPAGGRACRACKFEAALASRERAAGRPMQKLNRDKTHCKHGHEFTPANTIIRPNGSRNCRACMGEAQRRYKERGRSLSGGN